MSSKITEIKDNEVHKAMLKVFRGRSILFLENDFGLYNADGNLEIWLIENKVKYNVLYDIGELDLEYIKKQIERYSIIAFETTWTYEISKQIEQHIASLKDKKTIVECYISEPSWWYKPKGIKHDVYVLQSCGDDMDEWKFNKLRLDKAIWEK